MIHLDHLALKSYRGHRVLILRSGPAEVKVISDRNLGVIASTFSYALKCIKADMLGLPRPTLKEADITPNEIELGIYEITPLVVFPFRWKLSMTWANETGREFSYTANLESTVDSVIAGYAGALKFFAIKSGLAVMDLDMGALRNLDRAGEEGFFSNQGGTS